MLIVILIISIALSILACKINEWEFYPLDCILIVVSIILIFLCLLFIIVCGIDVSRQPQLNQTLKMYEEENNKIENDIQEIIKQYKDYETNTYNNYKNENFSVIVSMYPELKTNDLVTKQIEIYNSNNEKIKETKKEIIDIGLSKWWLYFGK
jgi:predicted PurR-regulated permease PerM